MDGSARRGGRRAKHVALGRVRVAKQIRNTHRHERGDAGRF